MVITLSYCIPRQTEDPRAYIRLRSRKLLGSGEETVQAETAISRRLGRGLWPDHSQDRRTRCQYDKIIWPVVSSEFGGQRNRSQKEALRIIWKRRRFDPHHSDEQVTASNLS